MKVMKCPPQGDINMNPSFYLKDNPSTNANPKVTNWRAFLKRPENFRARKAIRKTLTSLFCKTGLFMCCKGDKNSNNCEVL